MFIAVVLLAVALVAFLVPTAVAGVSAFAWLTGGLLAWAVDVLLGGYVFAAPARRAP